MINIGLFSSWKQFIAVPRGSVGLSLQVEGARLMTSVRCEVWEMCNCGICRHVFKFPVLLRFRVFMQDDFLQQFARTSCSAPIKKQHLCSQTSKSDSSRKKCKFVLPKLIRVKSNLQKRTSQYLIHQDASKCLLVAVNIS